MLKKSIPCLGLLAVMVASPATSSIIRVTNHGAVCNGVTDDASAIQAAFNAAGNRDSVKFPGRVCAYGNNLILSGKRNITLYGSFSTVLRATNPLKSAIKIINGRNIAVRKLALDSPNSTSRTSNQNAIGFFVQGGTNITFDQVKISKTANAGILFLGVAGGHVWDSIVLSTLSDGIHITNNGSKGSSGITIFRNYASNTGDDSFSTVAQNGVVNRSIQISGNVSVNSKASGVTVEGSDNVLVTNNSVTASKASGIRVGSNLFFRTSRANNVTVSNNLVRQLPTSGGLPAIFVFAEYQNVSNIHVLGNQVEFPRNYMAFQLIGVNGRRVTSTNLEHNIVVDPNNRITDCINIGPGTSGISLVANLLFEYGGTNERSCH